MLVVEPNGVLVVREGELVTQSSQVVYVRVLKKHVWELKLLLANRKTKPKQRRFRKLIKE